LIDTDIELNNHNAMGLNKSNVEDQERRFALILFLPSFLLLLLITTAPLVFLAWNSLQKLDLGMPWISGFAGFGNYVKMGEDPRFWNSLGRPFIGLIGFANSTGSSDHADSGDFANRPGTRGSRSFLAHIGFSTRLWFG
jgi:hypothetical protein